MCSAESLLKSCMAFELFTGEHDHEYTPMQGLQLINS